MIDSTIETIYSEHSYSVYQRCLALLGDSEEAYDALHEVFIKLIDKRPRLDDGRPIGAWLNRVATNHCFNQLRARRYRRHLSVEELGGVADKTPMQFMVLLSEQRDVIRTLLLATDERTRHVVLAYFFDEQSVDGIARDLDISVPTVRRVLKRFLTGARRKLTAAERRTGVAEVNP